MTEKLTTLSNPLSWPLYPFMPVVRKDADISDPEHLGVLVAVDLVPDCNVYIINIGDVLGRDVSWVRNNCTHVRYDSMKDLGQFWRVD